MSLCVLGLVRKDLLPLHAGGHMCETYCDLSTVALCGKLRRAPPRSCWVIKLPASSNGFGMVFVKDPSQYTAGDFGQLLDDLQAHGSVGRAVTGTSNRKGEETAPASRVKKSRFVLQRYVLPALIEGRKFHIRALVAVVGMTHVYMHTECRYEGRERLRLHLRVRLTCMLRRVLLAVKPFSMADLGDSFVHATNCSVQQRHPEYDSKRYNQCLRVHPARDVLFAGMRQATHDVFASLATDRRVFYPLPNCHEVFGLDFMVEAPTPRTSVADGDNEAHGADECKAVDGGAPLALPGATENTGSALLHPTHCGKIVLLEANPSPSLSLFGVESLVALLPDPLQLPQLSLEAAAAQGWERVWHSS